MQVAASDGRGAKKGSRGSEAGRDGRRRSAIKRGGLLLPDTNGTDYIDGSW